MTLVAQSPRGVHAGSGTTGPFTLQDDNGVPIQVDSTTHVILTKYLSATATTGTVLTYGVDYTLAGVPSNGVTYTLTNALVSGEFIQWERSQPLTQNLDLDHGGDFSATNIEARFDTNEQQIQENRTSIGRSLKAHWKDTNAPSLPATPTEDKLLARNSAGDLVYKDMRTISDSVVLGGGWADILEAAPPASLDDLEGIRSKATYAVMTAMSESDLTDGCQVHTLSRSGFGDGGSGSWRYKVYTSGAPTPNGGTVLAHDSISNAYFERVYSGPVHASWFVSPSASVDKSSELQAVIDAADSSSFTDTCIIGGDIEYLCDAQLDIPAGVKVDFAGAKLVKTAGASHDFIHINGNNVTIENLRVDGGYNVTVDDAIGVVVGGAYEYINITNVHGDNIFGVVHLPEGVSKSNIDVISGDYVVGVVSTGSSAPSGSPTPSVSDCNITNIYANNFRDEVIDINTNTVNVNMSNIGGRAGAFTISSAEAVDIGGDTCENISLSNVFLDMNGQTLTGVTIKTNGSGSTTENISLSNINVSNSAGTGNGLKLSTGINKITATGINISGVEYGVLGTVVNKVVIDNYNLDDISLRGFSFDGDTTSSNLIIGEGTVELTSAGQYAVYVTEINKVKLGHVSAKGGQRTLFLDDIDILTIDKGVYTDSAIASGTAYGGLILDCNVVSISGPVFKDHAHQSLVIQNCDDVSISGLILKDNVSGWYGSQITDVNRLVMTGVSGGGAGDGIRFTGTNDSVILSNNVLRGFAGTKISGTSTITNYQNNGDNLT